MSASCVGFARAIGVAILFLIASIVAGGGGPNLVTISLRENLLGLALLTMVIGLLLGWKWEGIGSLLIFGGFALFAAVNQPFRLNTVMVVWLFVGLLYLICWWKRKAVNKS